MSLRTARTALLGLLTLLTLLAVVGPVFYHWQNAEGRLGGGISLSTVLWLAWVIAMLFRGVVQLALLYLVVHWPVPSIHLAAGLDGVVSLAV